MEVSTTLPATTRAPSRDPARRNSAMVPSRARPFVSMVRASTFALLKTTPFRSSSTMPSRSRSGFAEVRKRTGASFPKVPAATTGRFSISGPMSAAAQEPWTFTSVTPGVLNCVDTRSQQASPSTESGITWPGWISTATRLSISMGTGTRPIFATPSALSPSTALRSVPSSGQAPAIFLMAASLKCRCGTGP